MTERNGRPQHYIGCSESQYLICNEDAHLAQVLAKLEAWQRYVDRDPNRDGWIYMSARQMSEQMMGIVGKSQAHKHMTTLAEMGLIEKRVTEDPGTPNKYRVKMGVLAEMKREFADVNGYVVDKPDPGESVTRPVHDTDTPCPQHGHPVRSTDTTKSTNNDCLSDTQARTHEDEPKDSQDDTPTDSLETQIKTIANRVGYDIRIGQCVALAMSLVDHLEEHEIRPYLIDKFKQGAVNEKPLGKILHYMGDLSDVEQWRGDDGSSSDDQFFGLFD